jgi:hypothetical protein
MLSGVEVPAEVEDCSVCVTMRFSYKCPAADRRDRKVSEFKEQFGQNEVVRIWKQRRL